MNSTILVGNACIFKNKNLGKTIDQYHNVVRFNNFKLDNFTSDLGSKTTTVFYNHPVFISNDTVLDNSKYIILYNSRPKTCGKHVFNKKIKYNINESKFAILNFYDKSISKFYAKLQYPRHQLFSTGFLAIVFHLFILNYSSITIANFDFQSHPNNVEYFNKHASISKLHSWSTEKKYVYLWHSKGLIHFLH